MCESVSRKQQDRRAAVSLLKVVQQRWPHAFPINGMNVRPWKIGIVEELVARLDDYKVDKRMINIVLQMYQARHRISYYSAIASGGPRYDLEGKADGCVAPGHQQWAENTLRGIEKRKIAVIRAKQEEEKAKKLAMHQEKMRKQREDAMLRKKSRPNKASVHIKSRRAQAGRDD